MKKFILSAAILGLTTVAFAQDNTPADSTATGQQQTQEATIQSAAQSVKLEELPAAVKKTLTVDAYKDWTPTEATLSKDESGAAIYQIIVTKGDKKGTIKIKEDGTPVE